MPLTREQILAASDVETEEVHVPEWASGGDDVVVIAALGALPRARLQDWVNTLGTSTAPATAEPADDDLVTCDSPPAPAEEAETPPEKTYTLVENFKVMVRWCVESIVDPETRAALFSLEDIEALGRKSPVALRRLYDAALALNLETEDAVEDAEKN